jgi:hypothetical protein
VDNQKKFLDWAGKELGVTDLYGWYNVKQTSLDKLGGICAVIITPNMHG